MNVPKTSFILLPPKLVKKDKLVLKIQVISVPFADNVSIFAPQRQLLIKKKTKPSPKCNDNYVSEIII